MNKPTWQELLETGLYASAGAAAELQDALPRLVDKGRSALGPKIGIARVIGQFAVNGAEKEIHRRSDSVIGQVSELITLLFGNSSSNNAEPDESVDSCHEAEKGNSGRVKDSTIIGRTAAGSPEDLPIGGYTTLSAQQIIARLENLSNAELDGIANFELAHRNRASIARAIAAKRHKIE